MTQTFIWDLDGTLLDSYEAILDGIEETYAYYGLDFERESIRSFILEHSVQDLLERAAGAARLDAAEMNAFRASSLREKNAQVKLMDGARDVLEWAVQAGFQQFVYTHKGVNAHHILADLGLTDFFIESVTAADGFERKPHPAAVDYLVDKYGLDRQETYYIGDRALDVDLAQASGIRSIHLCPARAGTPSYICSLREIPQLFGEKEAPV